MNRQVSTVNSRPSTFNPEPTRKIPLFLFICIVLAPGFCTAEAWGQVPGRVTYRDGSPCAYCWLNVQLKERSFKVRADGEGYFELEIDGPELIKRIRTRNLGGERVVEDGLLFVLLHKNNPQLDPVIKDLRKRLQTYRVFTNSALVQHFILENCYFIVQREVSLIDRVSRFRSVEVDLSQLEVLEACAEEQACIRLRPARVKGERNRLDQGGGVVLFDARYKEHIPAVLHSIALLARSCGNLETQVMTHENFAFSPGQQQGN